MEYIKRLIKILAIPFKFLFKLFAMLLWILVLFVHFLIIMLSSIPIFALQIVEWILVRPIYYIVTGKNYILKYNQITNMAFDLLFLYRPYYIKSNKPKGGKHLFNLNYELNEDQDLFMYFWNKIMEINLKLKYD